jgi:hypothetical protein
MTRRERDVEHSQESQHQQPWVVVNKRCRDLQYREQKQRNHIRPIPPDPRNLAQRREHQRPYPQSEDKHRRSDRRGDLTDVEFAHEELGAGREDGRGEVDDDGEEADVEYDEPFAPAWPVCAYVRRGVARGRRVRTS